MRSYLKISGYLALGLLGLQAAQAQNKPWVLTATVRSFYDDNYSTAPSSPAPGQAGKQSSFGFEVNPGAEYVYKGDQTDLKLDYAYTLKYFENRVVSADHAHEFNARVDQKFGTDRYLASLKESFVVAQESAIIDPALAVTPLRSNGDNLRNLVSLDFSAQLTEPLTWELGYENGFYDYSETGTGSRSALLDRIEHKIMTNLRWKLKPTSIFLTGYSFRHVEQTSSDFLDATLTLAPSIRDRRSHYVYVGMDHQLNQKMSLHPRLGVEYAEYPNALPGARDNSFGPYADLSAQYNYAEESMLSFGVRHQREQTDVAVVAVAAGSTLDAATTAVYANCRHRITAKIHANLLLQFQHQKFNQGTANDQADKYFIAGLNLNYNINEYLTASAGYNLDRLNSDLASRAFTRNRVFIGLTATY